MKTKLEQLIEKEKILDFARELYGNGKITKQQLEDTYFNNFIRIEEYDEETYNLIAKIQ